jgi:hypothetical protein
MMNTLSQMNAFLQIHKRLCQHCRHNCGIRFAVGIRAASLQAKLELGVPGDSSATSANFLSLESCVFYFPAAHPLSTACIAIHEVTLSKKGISIKKVNTFVFIRERVLM